MDDLIIKAKKNYLKDQRKNKLDKYHKWYYDNLDRAQANSREYYKNNKAEIYAKGQVKYTCERCGKELKLCSKRSHDKRTKCGNLKD